MSRKLEFLRTSLRLVYQFLFALLLSHSFLAIFTEEVLTVPFIVGLLGMFLISYLTRAFVPKMLMVIAVHFVLAGIMLLCPYSLGNKIVYVCVAISLLVIALHPKYKEGVPALGGVPVFTMLIIFAMLLLAHNKGIASLVSACYIIPIIMITIYIVMVYLDGLKTYMGMTQSITGIPMKRLVFTNSIFIMGILLIFVVSIFILNVLGIEDDAFPLAKGLASAFLLTFYGVIYVIGSLVNKFTHDSPDDSATANAAELLKEQGSSRLGDVLDMLLKISLVLVAVYVLYRVVKKFGRWLLTRKQNTMDIIERADVIDVNDVIAATKKKDAQTTAEGKIRKLYRSVIYKQKHYVEITPYKSARDFETEIRNERSQDIGDITDMYAKVRYGTVVADKQLVKEMKELVKRSN